MNSATPAVLDPKKKAHLQKLSFIAKFRPPQTGSRALRRQPRIPRIWRLRHDRRRAPHSAGLCGRGDWRPTESGLSWRFCAPGLQCRFSNLRNCRVRASETGLLFVETGCNRAVTAARSTGATRLRFRCFARPGWEPDQSMIIRRRAALLARPRPAEGFARAG